MTDTEVREGLGTDAPPAIACHGLAAGYGDLVVVRDFDLSVAPGKIVAMLGPNGAGKTTVLRTLSGFLAPLGGTMEVGGETVSGGSPRRMSRSRVVLVPDTRALFTDLTTSENLRLAVRQGGCSISEALDLFPALRHRATLRAGMLSGGEQQMLALARALVQDPKVLLIDEMSLGLAPVVVESLMPIVRRVADESGTAVVLVEQHVRLALEVADSVVVLVHGDVVLRGTAAEVQLDNERLEAAYLGGSGRAVSA
jgi:branched-chain amino acid transport system ATP-binding protein